MKKRPRMKDFQRKKFRNPLFPKKNQPKIRLTPAIAAASGFFALILCLAFFNYSSVFKITDLQVSGSKLVAAAEIEAAANDYLLTRRFLVFNQDSIIFLSKSALRRSLEEQFPLGNVEINKDLLHTLKIAVTEKDFSLLWQTGNEKYFIDQRGIAADRFSGGQYTVQAVAENTELIRPQTASEQLPLMIDQSNQPVALSEQIIGQDLVNFIIEINRQLKSVAGLDLVSYSVKDRGASEIIGKTQEGWEVMLNSKIDPVSQAKLLNMILTQRVTDRATLKYIDLRYEGKVFYQ